MVTANDLASWNPSGLAGIADQLVARRSSLLALQGELDGGAPPPTWTGTDADSASGSHDRLVEAFTVQVSELATAIGALDTASSALQQARSTLESARSLASRNGYTMDLRTGVVRSTTTYTSEAEAIDDQRLVWQVAQQISDAVTAADSADVELAGALLALTRTNVNAYGSLDTIRGLGDLEGMSTQQQVEHLLANPAEAESLLPFLDDEVKTALGERVGSEIEQLGHDESSLTVEEVERASEWLDAFGEDSTVMAATYETLGPDGLVGVTSAVTANLYMTADPRLEAFATKLRDGLATASNAPGFDDEQFARDLVRYATYDPTLSDLRHFEETYVSGGANASLLRFYFSGQGLSDGFVSGAIDQLDAWERQDGNEDQIWYGHNGSSALDNLPPAQSGGSYADPMAALMGQLGEHPGVGLDFFREGGDTDGNGIPDRQDFYFGERDWQADGFAGISHAVLGIGTDPAVISASPKDAGMLVSTFVHDVTGNENFSTDTAVGGSADLGRLLKFYTPAVEGALSGPNDADFHPNVYSPEIDHLGTLANYPLFVKRDLDAFVPVAMVGGSSSIAEGLGAYQQVRLNNAAEALAQARVTGGDVDTVKNEISSILHDNAKLSGYYEYRVGATEIAEAVDQDHARRAFTSMVSKAAGLVPVPGASQLGEIGGKAVGFAWDQARTLTTGEINSSWADATTGVTATAEERAADSLRHAKVSTYLALVQAGILEVPPANNSYWQPDGELISVADIPPERFSDYLSRAENGLNDLGPISTLEGAYMLTFQSYYG